MTASTAQAAKSRDDFATLLALGAVAYMLQTMIHEALGHGGECLAEGGHVTLVTPLWMRCSLFSTALEAAGPAANVMAALLSWAVLRTGAVKSDALRFFLWLCLAFNGLVAAAYLGVGGALAFGDWTIILSAIHPAWLWRVGALATSVAAYYLVLRILAATYARIGGPGANALPTRALLPGVGAAVVALAAQIHGQGLAAGGLVLPMACTLGVGLSLLAIARWIPSSPAPFPSLRITRCVLCIVGAFALSLAYILIVGPGFSFR